MRAIPTILALSALWLCAQPASAQSRKGPDDPAAMFAKRCSNCHFAPDPKRSGDRAWLSQVAVTA